MRTRSAPEPAAPVINDVPTPAPAVPDLTPIIAVTAARERRLPYKVPSAWLDRRVGVPLAAALAAALPIVSAESADSTQAARADLVLCLLFMLCLCTLSRRWRGAVSKVFVSCSTPIVGWASRFGAFCS